MTIVLFFGIKSGNHEYGYRNAAKSSLQPLEDAREIASLMLTQPNKNKTRSVIVYNRLQRDFAKASSSAEISRIMWAILHSSEGNGVINSKWKAFYGTV